MRLGFLLDVGLDYLSLTGGGGWGGGARTLSGGESQRIRLATQIGSRLVNVLYILITEYRTAIRGITDG